MGPFPHDAPKSIISDENPAGTDGFEFVEFSHPNPEELRELFGKMGYVHTATHKTKDVQLWQQGDITYVLNNDPDSHARRFVDEHGPCAPSMAWRVVNLFGFKEIRFFDIQGKFTGLMSRALTSPCGRIRIPINEDRGETGQIVEYLRRYKGEGIQHIAVGARNIYDATDEIASRGIKFMKGPPKAYYDLSKTRVHGHQEPLDRMMKNGIMIDGEGVVGGGETRILLQIFSKTVIGPIFFEFIQRKGDDGFGEGNFKALFESIEADQIERGVL